MTPIRLSDYKNIVILNGAGVSAASGIPTFRGKNGLWNDPEIAALSEYQTFVERPADVWEFWGSRRQALKQFEPNVVHEHLVKVERDLAGTSQVLLVTQNVDGLLVQAGARGAVELHGRITRTRCSDVLCSFEPIEDDFSHPPEVPSCPICGANLRADIVMFGEQLPADTHRATVALRDVDLFLAIGTSGTVYPAAGFAGSASHVGARTVFINMEEMDPPNPHFDESYIGPAEQIVPELLVP